MKRPSFGFVVRRLPLMVSPWNGSTENNIMLNRRSVMVGGLVMARIAQAQSGKPMLVFVGHEL